MERDLSEDERRALRGSKFAPLPAVPSRIQPRLAHPNGPMATNKAAALAKFLERKLQQPGGLNSIDSNLLELAVKNAKEAVIASNGGASSSGRAVRHVSSFGSSEENCEEPENEDIAVETRPQKKKHNVVLRDEDRGAEILKKKKKQKKVLQGLKIRKSKWQKKFKS